MATPIRVALVGCGIFARDSYTPVLLSEPVSKRVHVVALYSRSEESALRLRADKYAHTGHVVGVYHGAEGLDQLLARQDIDAVFVLLPIESQGDAIRKALLAGKHVLSEKPIAPTAAAARELIALHAERAASCLWGIAENFRCGPIFSAVCVEIVLSLMVKRGRE
jgi:predicted dehydrogenase